MDRIKRSNGREEESPKPKQMSSLLAEWRQDYRMAKMRNETGTEPAGEHRKSAVAQKPLAGKEKTKSHNLKGIDIPF